MPEMKEYQPGTFCWLELATTDSSAAKKFYTGLFGWSFKDSPAGPNMVYTMLQIDGKDVAALYQQDEKQKSQGVPPHWLPYVSVASADQTSETAQQLGGRVIVAPFDVFDVGRMAVIQDSTGAAFAVWQPRAHIGAKLVNELNTVCWNELSTNDTAKAQEFYTKLFGWSAKTDTSGPHAYTEFMRGDTPLGGMLKIRDAAGTVPPHWLGYFAVEDCNRSADKAKALGAGVLVPPTDIPNVGRFAVLKDPQGAAFAIIKLTHLG